MTTEVEEAQFASRYGLLLTALAPVVPQILGSAFNIWYNATVIEPMLTAALRQRFFATVVVYNAVVYPIGVYLWLKRIFSFRDLFHRLQTEAGDQTPPLGGTDAGAPAIDSFAVVCSGDLRRRLVPVHTCFYWRAASSPKSVGSALALASADFVLCLRVSSRSRIHSFWSSLPANGDCFRFSFVTNAPIARRTSSLFRCAVAESCGRFRRRSVRSPRCCCCCWRRDHRQ